MPGFEDILGHEKIKEHFRIALQRNQVSHAYILTGEAGTGRKTLANAFAMTLLCENSETEACGNCHSCLQFLSHNHPDVIYVTHEKPNSIGVDDVRTQLVNDITIKPYSSKYKVYIIDEAELMTIQAQNAILKTIEEPPEYAVILLLTTNSDAFLQTILSRCITLKLKPLYDRIIRDYLKNKLGIPDYQADVYTAFARGNLGKAIALSTSKDFFLMQESVLQLLKFIHEIPLEEVLDFIKELKDSAVNIRDCLDFMELWYRDILMFKATQDTSLFIFKQEFKVITEIAEVSSFEGLENILKAVKRARIRLDANVNFDLTMELLLLVMKEN